MVPALSCFRRVVLEELVFHLVEAVRMLIVPRGQVVPAAPSKGHQEGSDKDAQAKLKHTEAQGVEPVRAEAFRPHTGLCR